MKWSKVNDGHWIAAHGRRLWWVRLWGLRFVLRRVSPEGVRELGGFDTLRQAKQRAEADRIIG